MKTAVPCPWCYEVVVVDTSAMNDRNALAHVKRCPVLKANDEAGVAR